MPAERGPGRDVPLGAADLEQFARRNAVAGELLVRLHPERFVAADEISV
jgi:hypothetical protein